MPTYSYACTACEHRFDVQQSFTDDALTVCPDCGGRLRKLFGNVGVVFKGSGFYRTDARKDGSRSSGRGTTNASLTGGAEGSSGGSGSSGSSTAAPAASTSGGGASSGSSSSGSSSGASTTSSSGGSGGTSA